MKNVFEELKLDNAEELEKKADTLSEISKIISQEKYTQNSLCKKLNIKKSKSYLLIKEKISKLSIEELRSYLNTLLNC